MRKALSAYVETRPRADRYLYRRRSLSPDEEEDFFYYTKPELSRDSHVSSTPTKHRSRSDRHEHKRRRERSREWEEAPDTDVIYEVVDDSHLDDTRGTQQVYMSDSPHHPFRSSSHDTSFLWRSSRAVKRDDEDHFYHHRSAHFNGKRFSLSYSNLPIPTLNIATPEKRHRSTSSKFLRPPQYGMEQEDERLGRRDRGMTSRYLEVPQPTKQYTDWEVEEIV